MDAAASPAQGAAQAPDRPGQQVFGGMPERLYVCTPTRLLTWLDCPRRYRFAYLERPPLPKGPPWAHTSLGAAAHTALARWYGLPFAQRVPLRGRDLVRQAWLRDGFRDDAQSATARELAAEWVHEYVSRIDPADEPVGIERVVSSPTRTLVITGRVDRIDYRDERLVIVDYKTGRRPPTDDDARSSLALGMYAVAARRTLRRPVGRVELHHLPTGQVAAADHDDAALDRKVAEAESIARDAATADAAYAAGDRSDARFPAAPSPGCSWCDFRRHCPQGQEAAPDLEPWSGLPRPEEVTP